MTQASLPAIAPRLSPSQIQSVVSLVRRAARAEILPRFQNLSSADVRTKSGPTDLVTQADTEAEAMIRRGIARLFPGAAVLGEEQSADDPEALQKVSDAELAFIIDPVDGTWNFAHGLPLFGVILSATRYGKPIFGMLYDAISDDWVMAAEDGPAELHSLTRQPRRLSLSAGKRPADLSGYAHLSLMPRETQEKLAPLLTGFGRASSLRCSCHEYRLLSQGAADFILSTTLNPWDHAAGVFICQQAGGIARFLDGEDYRIDRREGQLIVASDEATWDAVAERIKPAFEG